MALGMSEVYLMLRAVDTASPVIKNFQNNLVQLDKEAAAIQAQTIRRGQSLATMGIGMAAVGVAGVYAFNKMADAAVAYQQSVALTYTQTDKLQTSMKEIGQIGQDIASKIPVAFEKIQPTLYDIFSSIDVTAAQSKVLLTDIAKASVAGQADMQTVGRATIAVMNTYGLSVKDATHVNDVMFQLVRKGVGTYQDFTNVIGRVTPAGKRAGQTFEQVAGMMAFMTRNGLSAANSVAPVSQALNGLSKPAVIKNLHDLGVQVVDSTGKFRPMIDIVHDLKLKLDPLPNAVKAIDLTQIFKGGGNSIASMKFWVTAMTDSNNLLGEMTTSMDKAKGASDAAYKIMSETPQAKIDLMKNAFHNLEINVGKVIIPIKVFFVEVLTKVFSIFNAMPGPIRDVIVAFGAFAAAALIVVGVITAVVGAMALLSASTAKLSTMFIGTAIRSMVSFGQTVVRQGIYIGETIGKIIAQFILMSAAAVANALRTAASWLAVRAAAAAASTATEAGVTSQIAGWVALKLAAMANAIEIAAAWLIAEAPILPFIAGLAAVGGAFLILKDELSNNKKDWKDWAEIFVTGGIVAVAFEKIFGKKAVAPYSATSSYKPDWGPARKLANGGAPDLTDAGKMSKQVEDLKKQSFDLQKYMDALLNPKKKHVKGNNPVVDQVTQTIDDLKKALKLGSTDIAKYSKEIPIALELLGKGSTGTLSKDIAGVQALIAKLSNETPNQLKAMGIKNINALIAGLKSKEAEMTKAYDDLVYKTMLAAQTKTQALAEKGAVAINSFISNMSGSLGSDVNGAKVAMTLGADVIAAYADGMTKSDPKARLAAHNALVKSIGDAFDDTLKIMNAARDEIIKDMKQIHDAVTKAITEVGDFTTAYQKAMAASKVASEALADDNKKALDKFAKDYKDHLSGLDTTMKIAESSLTGMSKDIKDGIIDSMDFSKAASEANKFENSFLVQLKINADKAQKFGEQIKQLVAMGLSADSVDQIAKAGIDAGASIAKNLIDGGVNAINDTNAMVKSVIDLANSLGDSTAKQFYQTGVDQAKAAAQGWIDSNGPDSKTYQAMVDSGNAAVKQMASTMGGTFADALAAQTDAATKYADKIKQLISMGLSQDALVQVLAAGTEAGSAIADSLIAGGVDGIKKVNALVNSIKTMADSVGTSAATTFYGKGLDSANSMIDAFTKNFGPDGAGRKTLMSAMDSLAESMNRSATVTITTLNPGLLAGGTPNSGGPSLDNGARIFTGTPDNGQGNTHHDSSVPGGTSVVVHVPVIQTTNPDPEALAASIGWHVGLRVRGD